MGKHLRMKHLDDESHDKQPGCVWGLVHVLDYHHWQSNVKKMIHYCKFEGPAHDRRNWSPAETNMYPNDAYEEEKLLHEKESLHHSSKRSRATKKRSLRARIKALISEEISKENAKGGFSFQPSLQRTYSIHHLESMNDGFNKICRDCKNKIIFLPENVENGSSQSLDTSQTSAEGEEGHETLNAAKLDFKEDPDVFEIFKVDKELLLKTLQDSDEGIANFSRSTFGLNTKTKFSKSRSFPVAELGRGRKLKPVKLESKQKEVWSFPKENKFQTEEVDNKQVKNGDEENGIRKRTHRRSFSLNESMDKYARLFENSLGKDAKLKSSKSLKLSNEYGLAPLYFTRIHSLSYIDSYFSNLNFEVSGDNPSGNGSVVIEKDSEEENVVGLLISDEENAYIKANIEEDHESLRKVHSLKEEEKDTDDEISEKIISSTEPDKYPKKKNSDLDYVRHLLEQSGIEVDPSELTWHSSDQPLGPQLFEDLEAHWAHKQDELTGLPDFHGCWHHQMMFDLVNEALVEVYDVSFPYYPKALSSSCYVRPFTMGNRITEEVSTSIGTLVDVKAEEKQSLDCIVGRDLGRDRSWMNLQMESEFIALHLEDIIFNELLQEVMFC